MYGPGDYAVYEFLRSGAFDAAFPDYTVYRVAELTRHPVPVHAMAVDANDDPLDVTREFNTLLAGKVYRRFDGVEEGPYDDLAIISVDDDPNRPYNPRDHLRPRMPVWGGPTHPALECDPLLPDDNTRVDAFEEPAVPALTTLYGHGVGTGETWATQPRAGFLMTCAHGGGYRAIAPVMRGDSGSGATISYVNGSGILVGGEAFGIFVLLDSRGFTAHHAASLAQADASMTIDVVLEGEEM